MNNNFENAAATLFDEMAAFFDELSTRAPDLDADFVDDSVFRLALDEGGEILISKHESTAEIWLSAPNGGFHFRLENGKWIDTRDQKTLGDKITQSLAALGLNVKVPF